MNAWRGWGLMVGWGVLLAALAWTALGLAPGSAVRAAPFTCTPVTDLVIDAPGFVTVGFPVSVTAVISPVAASEPITLTWSPPPAAPPAHRTAVYTWTAAGQYPLTVTAVHCGGVVTATGQANVATRLAVDLQIDKRGPRIGIAGVPIVYTLTVTNSGGSPAADLLITDTLPLQSVYSSGGMLVGRSVRWLVPTLAGYGGAVQVNFSVLAGSTVVNQRYGADAVTAAVAGTVPVTTTLVDTLIAITPGGEGVLTFGSSDVLLQVELPAGSVDTPAELGLLRQGRPLRQAPSTYQHAGRSFQLLTNNELPPVLQGPVTLRIGYGVQQEDPTVLSVAAWDGTGYSRSGIVCLPDTANRQLVCTWTTPALTEVVMLKPLGPLYLPGLLILPAPAAR